MLYRKERNRYIPVSKNDKCYTANSVIGIFQYRKTISAYTGNSVIGIAQYRKTISAIPQKSVENQDTYFKHKAHLDLGSFRNIVSD